MMAALAGKPCLWCDVLGRWRRGPAYWALRAHLRFVSWRMDHG